MPVERAKDRRAQGFALLSVIWGTLILALLAGGLATMARTELALARSAREIATAEALADAGAMQAILGLLTPGEVDRWPVDGRIVALNENVRVTIQDLAGRVDVLRANLPLLTRLLVSLGLGEEEAERLIAAIDAYAARDAEDPTDMSQRILWSVDELRAVPGMTDELYRRLAPHVTVSTGLSGIDPAFAQPLLLQLLGLGPDQAEAVRSAPDEEDRRRRARQFGLPDSFIVRSRNRIFTLTVEARLGGGTRFVRKLTVMFTGDPRAPFRVEDWRQEI